MSGDWVREMRWGPIGPVYWAGPVFLQRKVWPVGKVRGRESSDLEMFKGLNLFETTSFGRGSLGIFGVGCFV